MKLTFENVSRRFGTVQALREVSFEIGSGELFFLLGPSGCGKTTLLRCIAGLERIDSGRLLFDGRDVTTVPPHRRQTAMVFQGYALWPHMTVAENVAFGLDVRGISRADRERRVASALERVQIAELAQRKPNELSGGQQQRVALARTLVVEPACLLLDEPLANLDAKLRRDMRHEIRRICKDSGLTAVYVTHDRKEALSMADRMAVLEHGRVLQTGSPQDIYVRPTSAFVAGFISETNFVPGTVLACAGAELTVDTACGALVASATPGVSVRVGQQVTLSLRPEVLRLEPNGAPAARNRFSARLRQTTYLGEMAEHVLAVGDTLHLKVFELNPRAAASSTHVALTVDPRDIAVLPDSPAPDTTADCACTTTSS